MENVNDINSEYDPNYVNKLKESLFEEKLIKSKEVKKFTNYKIL